MAIIIIILIKMDVQALKTSLTIGGAAGAVAAALFALSTRKDQVAEGAAAETPAPEKTIEESHKSINEKILEQLELELNGIPNAP